MKKKPVTLYRIEAEGQRDAIRQRRETAGCYLEKYGIKNIWQHWLMAQDLRLNEERQAEICGYVADEEEG